MGWIEHVTISNSINLFEKKLFQEEKLMQAKSIHIPYETYYLMTWKHHLRILGVLGPILEFKRPASSKRASYLGKTGWPDFLKLMKVLVTIGWNTSSSLHIPSWHITLFSVSYFLYMILRMPDNDGNGNLEICYSFFSRNS